MNIETEFVQLPLLFDAARLQQEVAQFTDSEWRPHPEGHPGNSALPLIASGGDPANDSVRGPMRATPFLQRMPYLRQVLAAFETVWGRTRLMRLDGNAEATPHTDVNYYWTQHARVHVPIITNPDVQFICGAKSVHMAAGESWIFDTWRSHNVINPYPTPRIHLVADTTGSAHFWELVERGRTDDVERRTIAFDPTRDPALDIESVTHATVMSPWEQAQQIELLEAHMPQSPEANAIRAALMRLHRDWRAAWARFGANEAGWPAYAKLRETVINELTPLTSTVTLKNGLDAVQAARSIIIAPALDDERTAAGSQRATRSLARARRLERPIFIVSSPRAGSTLLFETLAQSPSVSTIGGESHGVFEGIPAFHPQNREWHSNRLTEVDARPAAVRRLERTFQQRMKDRDGAPNAELRLLEKTPKNSLRIPFLASVFPDAYFVYLQREARDTMSSMLDAWRSGRYVTYRNLPDWEGLPWSLLLTPGWRELSGKPLEEVVASQWSAATRYLLDDLERLPADRWCIARYDALVANPQEEIERICRFVGIDWDRQLTAPLPLSKTTLTAPAEEKWRKNERELSRALPLVRDVEERARALFASGEPAKPRVAAKTPAPTDASAFRSVHTRNIPHLLEQLGISLLVSTYQTGRVISIRSDEGTLNTHFRALPSPMGIAVAPNGLAIGTKANVWHFQNQPSLTNRLEPKGKYDACYVPRASHVTGDIRIHEIAFAGSELWITNTRFSCLSTLDPSYSFVPRWRPRFITQLAAEDRCHLNGLCIIDNRPRFVTALGESNEAGGWRAHKDDGGLLIDIESNEYAARGLAMPHSPRWYDGKMWVLESAVGRLSTVDLGSGKIEPVAELPGFTRGLAFAGPFAFIGLSQVREKVFDGIPIAQKTERYCGVWVVDIRSGAIAGFLRFDGFVQEIFDIQVLRGIRYPELLEPDSELTQTAFVVPTQSLMEPATR